MMRDTISFMFIMTCYLLIAATIFSTLFRVQDQEKYGSLPLSFRTMFDYTLGNYDQVKLAYNNDSHSNLMMIHIVISNVFLLNFLIAILSTVYVSMIVIGDFLFKANMYAYIEKYELAKMSKKGYDQFVVHPAPLNLLTVLILPFVITDYSKKAGKMFSRMMFWIENIVMSIFFALILTLLAPIIFFRMLYHLFRAMQWCKFILIALWWSVFGIIILPFYISKDVMYFYKINCYEGSIQAHQINKIKKDLMKTKVEQYSNVHEVMKGIYIEMNRKKSNFTLKFIFKLNF